MHFLQDEFKISGYTDLLAGYDPSKSEDISAEYGFYLDDFFDSGKKPAELLGIFISAQRDDLFLLLDGDSMDINDLCDEWDNRIRVFSIMNGRSKAVQNLKYNIVQLIVYSGEKPKKNREGNLLMSRKIIIKGDLTNRDRIEIADDEAVELPFHMIPSDEFAPNEADIKKLNQMLPKKDDLLTIMKTPKESVNRKRGVRVQPKSYTPEDYDKIKEWLEK